MLGRIGSAIRRRVPFCNLRGVAFDTGGTGFRTIVFELNRRTGEIRFVDKPTRSNTPSKKTFPDVPRSNLPQMLVAEMAKQVEEVGQVDLIGQSFAGPVTRDGIVVAAPNIWGHAVSNVDLTQMIDDATGVRPVIANDMVPMAYREAVDGVARQEGIKRFGIVTVSTGVGAAFFEGDRVLVGEMGIKGEIGHMPLPGFGDNVKCNCGGNGHLEALASGDAAARIAAELIPEYEDGQSVLADQFRAMPDKILGIHISQGVETGDPLALQVMKRTVEPMALGLIYSWVMMAPERFYLVGSYARGIGQQYLDAMHQEIANRSLFGVNDDGLNFARNLIKFGKDDDNGGVHGAAIAAAVQDNPGLLSRLRLVA